MTRAAWAGRLRALKREALTVWCVARHPRLPWAVRGLALAVAAYAFSPIDLIPDFIPLLGLLDDLLLVPLGVWAVLKMAPADVVAEARAQAAVLADKPVSRMAAAVIALFWLAVMAAFGAWAWRRFG
ncbi:hypothetical protein DCD74_09795 [Lysobacter oculi]|uniref:DUF1232 domain-containing protein n=1 Tax=Solilutibacter oculi TaxID=2698682 RepID=A0A344J7C2_9GAMM|nr:DUF1232 domain-containing protein [Lysobacter oculi]AXA84932.1 hypothetical protein DCD74_09795 [Lysobacter oculi]